MHILVFCDDKWHPAATIRAGLAPLSGDQFTFDWLEDGNAWPSVALARYDAVLLTKSNHVSSADTQPWMTPAAEAALVNYIAQGGGLLVVHSGTVGYDESPTLRAHMGGVFDRHPPQCDVTLTPSTDHPLTAGVEPFTVRDEHYFMTLNADQSAFTQFLTATSEHGTQPGGWAHRTQRICVLTPGHNVQVWLHPSFQQLLSNGLHWCAAGKTARA
jgi:uncharacterized protein